MGRLVMLLALGSLCMSAMAVDELAVIYNSQANVPPAITLGDWGYIPRTVAAKEAYKPVLVSRGRYGLKVTTLGRYTGMRMDFTTPIDITKFFNEKNIYLELYLRAAPDAKPAETPGTGNPGEMPMNPMPATPMMPPMAPPVAPPVAQPPMMPTADGAMPPVAAANDGEVPTGPEWQEPAAKTPVVPMPVLKNIRFTFFTEKGQGLLVVTPDKFHPKDEVGTSWVKVDIPLSLLKKETPVGGPLTRLLITSDEPVEFLIGRMAIVRDAAPFEMKMFIFPAFLEAGRRIFLAARIEPGLSLYETTWDFDTKAGETIDAKGDRVTHIYDAEGNYTITCTVRDTSGGKEPVVRSLDVKVSSPPE